MKTRFAVVLLAAFACCVVQAQDYPCYIASLKLKDNAVEVRFNNKAYWYYSKSQLQIIRGAEVISISEDDSIPSVKAGALYIPDGQQLDLWIPHISCQVRFQMTATPPGIYVTQRTGGVTGNSNTGEIFYPAPKVSP